MGVVFLIVALMFTYLWVGIIGAVAFSAKICECSENDGQEVKFVFCWVFYLFFLSEVGEADNWFYC